jgi:chromosome segregation ATPase
MTQPTPDERDTELARLRAEVETLNQRLGACQGGYELAEQEVKQLRATIARLEAEAINLRSHPRAGLTGEQREACLAGAARCSELASALAIQLSGNEEVEEWRMHARLLRALARGEE